jgi:hypothetical protein
MTKTPQTKQAVPATNSGVDSLFLGAMALNSRRFDDGCFDDAYHALEAALHLSEIVGSEDGPLLVEQVRLRASSWHGSTSMPASIGTPVYLQLSVGTEQEASGRGLL